MSKTPKTLIEGERYFSYLPSFDVNGDLIIPESFTLTFLATWIRALTIQQDEMPGDAELVRRVMGFSEIETLFNVPAILPDQAYQSGISAAEAAFQAGLDDAEADLDVMTESDDDDDEDQHLGDEEFESALRKLGVTNGADDDKEE